MPTLFARIMSFIIILFLIVLIITISIVNRNYDISTGDLIFLSSGTVLCVIIILYYVSNLSQRVSVCDNIMEVSAFKLGFLCFNKAKVRIPFEDIVFLGEFQSGMGNKLYIVYKTKNRDGMGKKIDIESDENKNLDYVKKFKAEYFPAYNLWEVSCRSDCYLKDLKELEDKFETCAPSIGEG